MLTKTAIGLLHTARKMGIGIAITEDKLQLKVPKGGVIDPKFLEDLNLNKEAIIDILQNEMWKTEKVIREEGNSTIQAGARPRYIPLSFAQERLWFLDQKEGSIPYHVSSVLRLSGELNVNALEYAIKSLVERHEVLRTVILAEDGKPYQLILNVEGFRMEITDARGSGDNPKKLKQQITRLIESPFDLSSDYMIRAHLIRLDADDYLLVLVLHHIASDGWSDAIIRNEITEFYRSFEENRPSDLPRLNLQYADYAIWQRKQLRPEVMQEKAEYWKVQLAGAANVELPLDFKRPQQHVTDGGRVSCLVDRETTERLSMLSQKEGVTLYMTLLSVLGILLHRYTGAEDLCIGCSVAGRQSHEIEKLVGFFSNTLALRVRLNGETRARELLRQVRGTTLEAYDNQELPFEKVVEFLEVKREASRNPLFQVMFVMGNSSDTGAGPDEGFHIFSEADGFFTAKFDLTLSVTQSLQGLYLSVTYRTALYRESTIQRLLEHYHTLLQAFVSGPAATVGNLNMLKEAERQQLLQEFSVSKTEYPLQSLLTELFLRQAERTPYNIALVAEGHSLTYRELLRRSACVANYLRLKGVQAGSLVAICMPRSADMIAGIFGIMAAGAAYVPIDPDWPVDRIGYLLSDLAAPAVVLDGSQENRIRMILENIDRSAGTITVTVEECMDIINDVSGLPVVPDLTADSLAYVIYTSGSTGHPKGTMVRHRSLVDYVYGLKERLPVEKCTSFATVSSLSADLGNTVLFTSLLSGASLHVLPEATIFDAEAMLRYFREHRVDCLKIVPSHWMALCTDQELLLPHRLLIFGGETLPPEAVARIASNGTGCMVVNHYGPTETTVGKLIHVIEPGQPLAQRIPIGRPFSNSCVYVLDSSQSLCAVGVPGQIHIGGDGVSAGYLNRPELTNEKFISSPRHSGAQHPLYCTGDLGRWLEDGTIEYMGRIDDQVKIRGYRVEPGEIENVLMECSSVAQVAVVARAEGNKAMQLIAYVVPQGRYDPEKILAWLANKLPDYMAPGILVEIGKMPLTSNGKIDKNALPDPQAEKAPNEAREAPGSEMEHQLAAIWTDLLDVEQVGVNDSFFGLGGHSLLAVRLVSSIRRDLKIDVTINDIFDYPTIGLLSTQLEARKGLEVLPVLTPQSRPARIPLSFNQEQLWTIDRLEGSVSYHIPFVLLVQSKKEMNAAKNALKEIVGRHEILRTMIVEEEGIARQVVRDNKDWSMEMIDGRAYEQDLTGRQGRIMELIDRPFDLSTDYKLRAHAVRLKNGKSNVVVVLHHIAWDGWSRRIFVKEFMQLYHNFLEGRSGSLPAVPVQYADYAIWQRQHLTGPLLEEKIGYWRKKLEGAENIRLPVDFPRPVERSGRGNIVFFTIDKELTEGLKQLSRREEVTLFMTLLSALNVLLYRYSGQRDISIGTVVAGRQQQDAEGVIGFFVNTLVMRSFVDGNESFQDLLHQIRETTVEALKNQDAPFGKVVESVAHRRDLSRNPLFQVVLVMQNDTGEKNQVASNNLAELSKEPVEIRSQTSKFDLTFSIAEEAYGLSGNIEYSTDLFKEGTIFRMHEHFVVLLRSIVEASKSSVNELRMLGESERELLIDGLNARQSPWPRDKTVVEIFKEQVLKTPQKIALTSSGESWTYRQLDQRSNQLGRYLRAKGISKECLVGICMDRSIELIWGLLGILKAGAAYVPIDPAFPAERIAHILSDTGIGIVLSKTGFCGNIKPGTDLQVILLDEEKEYIEREAVNRVPVEICPDHLAYVMYTSGSTGRPKGVLVEHRGIVSLVMGANYVEWKDADVLVSTGAPSFDATTFEYWGMLLNGGQLVMCPESTIMDPEMLKREISERGANKLWLTTGLLHQLIDVDVSLFAGIETLVMGGERLSREHIRRLRDASPFLQIVHCYGPTENTTFSTTYDIKAMDMEREVPIGRPLSNRQLYVLDTSGNPAPLGVSGEIYVGGAGLSRGYLNHQELTAEKFVTSRFQDGDGCRLYRTGDIGKWLSDGNLDFVGREDDQVKIRGYRVEPGEIEDALRRCKGVAQAAVVVRKSDAGTRQLMAYIVPEGKFDRNAIVDWLKGRLPEYMIPTILVEISTFPLNTNGKVDKRALLENELPYLSKDSHAAPRTEVEYLLASIWEELLGVGKVGIHDNFFELGGDSLVAIKLVSRMKQMSYDLHAKDVFKNQTIAELAAAVQKGNQLTTTVVKLSKQST